MNATTAAQGNNEKPFTVDTLIKMAESLKNAPPREYVLISPEGILYKGTADQLAPVLLKDVSFLNEIGSLSAK